MSKRAVGANADGGGGGGSGSVDSGGSSCKCYFDLPCYAARDSPVFDAAVDALMIVSFMIAAAGVVALVELVRHVQRNPRSYFSGKDRRPLLRPSAIEAAVVLAIAMMLCQALALLYLRRGDIVMLQIFRKSDAVVVGFTIPLFLFAFLNPMSAHVPSVGVFIKLLALTPLPHFVEAAAGIWFGVLARGILQENDPARVDALLNSQRPIRWLDAVSAILGVVFILAFLFWGRQQFLVARRELGPTILNRLRAREEETGRSTTPAGSSAGAGSLDLMRGGSPSALRFPLGQPTPPPPLPTAHPNAVTFPPSPPPPQAQQQQHLSQQLQPQRVNSLDVVVWQLRGGTVKTVRSVLGWVVAAGTGCLVCELVLAVVVEKSGKSLTAYYSWVGQLLINFAFLAGATLVFAVQIYRYARQGSRQQ